MYPPAVPGPEARVVWRVRGEPARRWGEEGLSNQETRQHHCQNWTPVPVQPSPKIFLAAARGWIQTTRIHKTGKASRPHTRI